MFWGKKQESLKYRSFSMKVYEVLFDWKARNDFLSDWSNSQGGGGLGRERGVWGREGGGLMAESVRK